MRFPVFIRRTPTGYSADVPDLPGCVATGTTVEHTRQMITQAIQMHLEMLVQHGQPIPPPSSSIEFAVTDESAEEFCTWAEIEVPQEVSAGT